MNARITPKEKLTDLSATQAGLIVATAVEKNRSYPQRVEYLRKLDFCTDDVKFQVLKESSYVSDELYDCLYDIYFGVVRDTSQDEQDSEQDARKCRLSMTDKQRNLIIGAAMRSDTVETSAVLLKKMDFCTDAEKFAVLYESLTPKHYSKLYTEYFGKPPSRVKPMNDEGMTKRYYPKPLKESEIRELINLYLDGMEPEEIGRRFNRDEKQIRQQISRCKKKGKYMDMFKDKTEAAGADNAQTETAPEPTAHPDELPKCFTACGKGFITTEGGLKLDEEPITALLRQKIIEKGLVQFWGEIRIIITPGRPAGMVVNVEE